MQDAPIYRQIDMTNAMRLTPQLHIHDFGHDRATIHPDLSSCVASA